MDNQDEKAREIDAVNRLQRYAQGIARKILFAFDLEHDDAWHEDISQTLLLEGWKVWRDTGDEGKARHRMSSRAKDEKEKLYTTLTEQPRPVSGLGMDDPTAGHREGAGQTERYHADAGEMRYSRMRPTSRASLEEDMDVQALLDRLPERTRQIVEMRMATMTVPEIAKKLQISKTTVERELAQLRKDLKNDDAE